MASDRHHWYLLRVLNGERQAQADKRPWRAAIGPAQFDSVHEAKLAQVTGC